jgi:hypothetical protein
MPPQCRVSESKPSGVAPQRRVNARQHPARRFLLRLAQMQLRATHLQLRVTRVLLRLRRIQMRLTHLHLRLSRIQLRVPRFQLRVPRFQLRLPHLQLRLSHLQIRLRQLQRCKSLSKQCKPHWRTQLLGLKNTVQREIVIRLRFIATLRLCDSRFLDPNIRNAINDLL